MEWRAIKAQRRTERICMCIFYIVRSILLNLKVSNLILDCACCSFFSPTFPLYFCSCTLSSSCNEKWIPLALAWIKYCDSLIVMCVDVSEAGGRARWHTWRVTQAEDFRSESAEKRWRRSRRRGQGVNKGVKDICVCICLTTLTHIYS